MTPAVLTREEAADYLKLSVAGLDRLAARREITRLKLGGRVVYRKIDLDAFLDRLATEQDASARESQAKLAAFLGRRPA